MGVASLGAVFGAVRSAVLRGLSSTVATVGALWSAVLGELQSTFAVIGSLGGGGGVTFCCTENGPSGRSQDKPAHTGKTECFNKKCRHFLLKNSVFPAHSRLRKMQLPHRPQNRLA